MRARFDDLQARRFEAPAREQLRALAREELGPFEYGRTLQGMHEYLGSHDSDAAFDSELALVHWNLYSRARWVPNTLHYGSSARNTPAVLITSRLDGPQAGTVRDIIIASLKAEAEGLAGKVVIDSGGHLAINPNAPTYSSFDRRFTDLRNLLSEKSKLPVVFDAQKEILPPNSVENVALYCGWYQLRNYSPPGTFSPGAVAYHVASFELASLKTPGERGWCPGLLSDGVAATLGPVNEPYLNAFPRPDEFFPLLLTGQLTVAETFWKTSTHASWRMALIADPLYNPYKSNPALKVTDLPQSLQRVFQAPAAPNPR